MSEPSRRVVYGEVSRFGHQQPPASGPPVPPARLTAWPPGAGSPRQPGPQVDESTAPGAAWGVRAAGFLLDLAPVLAVGGILAAGYVLLLLDLLAGRVPAWPAPAPVLAVVGGVLLVPALVWVAVQRWWPAGRNGQSLGRRRLGLRLVAVDNRRTVGVGRVVLRDLVHLLDGVLLVGFLWPLWDRRRQTFADKLTRTVVIDLVPPVPGPAPGHAPTGRYPPTRALSPAGR